jgi:uncharacterized protein (TIGR02996 family)
MLRTFLDEIVADPGDLATRRAFADWLMEQADPALQDRGEFIAVQLELADGRSRGARRRALEVRERELLTRYKEEWIQPLMTTGIPRRCLFHRGMVETIECDIAVFLKGAEKQRLFHLAPIAGLILRNVSGGELSALANLSAMPRVTSLTMRNLGMDAARLRDLLSVPANLSRLQQLDLDGNPLSAGGLAVLARWPGLGQLAKLSLRRCDLTLAAVRTLLESEYLDPDRGPVGLQRLDLRGNRRFRFREAQSLLHSLAGTFSSRRLGVTRRLLSSMLQRCRLDDFTALLRGGGPNSGSAIPGWLVSSRLEVRREAAALLEQIDHGPECLPAIVRRYFEPGMADLLRPVIRAMRFQVSALTAAWLDKLLQSEEGEAALRDALRFEGTALPLPVFAAFTDLCRRRLAWRTSHGRPLSPSVGQLLRGKQVTELSALAFHAAILAGEAANRHLPQESQRDKAEQVRRRASGKECAWLLSQLVRLLVEHEGRE